MYATLKWNIGVSVIIIKTLIQQIQANSEVKKMLKIDTNNQAAVPVTIFGKPGFLYPIPWIILSKEIWPVGRLCREAKTLKKKKQQNLF